MHLCDVSWAPTDVEMEMKLILWTCIYLLSLMAPMQFLLSQECWTSDWSELIWTITLNYLCVTELMVVVTIDEWKYMMFVWKDECGESESIRVVWCDLSVWDISWQKKERMREMYARTVESWIDERLECSRVWELRQSVRVKYYVLMS